MASYKHYDYDQLIFAPISLVDQLVPGTQCKLKDIICEHRSVDRKERIKSDSDRSRLEKRIKKLEQNADRVEKFLAENRPKVGSRGKEIQSNVTDNESAKMATSHGVVQGYNTNAMVDDKRQIVTHAQVFGSGSDSSNMQPTLEGAKERLEAIGEKKPLEGKQISAGTGYFSRP